MVLYTTTIFKHLCDTIMNCHFNFSSLMLLRHVSFCLCSWKILFYDYNEKHKEDRSILCGTSLRNGKFSFWFIILSLAISCFLFLSFFLFFFLSFLPFFLFLFLSFLGIEKCKNKGGRAQHFIKKTSLFKYIENFINKN